MIQSLQSWASNLIPPTITQPAFSRGEGFWTNRWASNLIPPTITEPAFSRGEGFWTNPSQEGLTGFFEKLTDINSHENWYQVTPYVAEFLCTVSNIAIIYSGIVNDSPELIFAGVASTISHAIPKQWLLQVDKLGVLVVAMRALKEYQVLLGNPKLLIPLVGAVSLNLIDAHLARTTGATWPHILALCLGWTCRSFFQFSKTT